LEKSFRTVLRRKQKTKNRKGRGWKLFAPTFCIFCGKKFPFLHYQLKYSDIRFLFLFVQNKLFKT